MTNQDARGILVGLEAAYRDLDPLAFTDDGIQLLNERIEAVRVAISALEKQDVPDTNVGNTISRQAAIDVIEAGKLTKLIDAETAVNGLKVLPSAQPEAAKDINVPTNDCISRRAAIDMIEAGRLTKLIDAETAVNGLKALPSAQSEQIWIPVTERLPEKGQKCLVSDKGHILIDVFWGRGGAYNWQFYTRDYEAWMPLVEPYNEERGNDNDGRD